MKSKELGDDFKKRIIDEVMEEVIENLPSYMRKDMKRAMKKNSDPIKTGYRRSLTMLELQKHIEDARGKESIEETMAKLNSIGIEAIEAEKIRLLEEEPEFFEGLGSRKTPYSPKEIDSIISRFASGFKKGGTMISKDFFRLIYIKNTQYNGDANRLLSDLHNSPDVRSARQFQAFRERYGNDPEARHAMRKLFGMFWPSDGHIPDPSNKYLDMALEKLKLHHGAYLGSDKGIEVTGIMGFLAGYFELKRLFPDFENVHMGYLSSVVTDDITNPGTNVFMLKRGTSNRQVESKIASDRYNFIDHVEALQRIMLRDGGCIVQNVQSFERPYRPVEEGLANLDFVLSAAFDRGGEVCLPIEYNRQQLQDVLKKSGISREVRQRVKGIVGADGVPEENIRQVVDEAKPSIKNALKELSVKKTKSGGHIQHLELHDYLLQIYLRLDSDETIEQVRTGRTLSTFLKLDPRMKKGRCTAGDGGYRQVSYQYGLDPAIQIIDLCFDSPQNCVAEAVLVSAADMYEDSDRITVVETVEAGKDAYLLPDYNGHPTWTYFLLEEIFRRSLGGDNPRIMFSTGVDEKPAISHFYAAVAEFLGRSEFLGFSEGTPPIKKYPDKIDPELDWGDFLTTARWRGRSNSAPSRLEKEDVVKKLEQEYLDLLREQYRSSPTLQEMFPIKDFLRVGKDFLKTPKHLFSETYLGAWGIKENLESSRTNDIFYGASEKTGLSKILDDPEKQELWVRFLRYIRNSRRKPRNAFQYKGQLNINNGCGLVRGFVYEITEERSNTFKGKMAEVRKHIGVQPYTF